MATAISCSNPAKMPSGRYGGWGAITWASACSRIPVIRSGNVEKAKRGFRSVTPANRGIA
ncbi:hypothetical protein GGQ94_000257 [Petrimonas sulfuriphila]